MLMGSSHASKTNIFSTIIVVVYCCLLLFIVVYCCLLLFIVVVFSFSRFHGILNQGYDYDFNSTYYFLLGCSQLKSIANTQYFIDCIPPAGDLSVNFPFHEPNFPAVSPDMYNPFTYNGKHCPV